MPNIIQISCLGNFGRFGNQLFQYCFARAYAEKVGALLEIPKDWIGKEIFKNIDHPPISKHLQRMPLDFIPHNDRSNIDLFGYFQFEKAYNFLSYKKIREWLQIKDKWLEMFPKEKDFYIACHLRRGDYETKYSHIYCTISEESYKEAVSFFGYNIHDIIWVTDKNPKVFDNCKFDFLPDFITLLKSDILFRSNSTFSVWASILGNCCTYSPMVEGITGINRFVQFQWGNWYKILNDYGGATNRKPSEFIFKE